jgi:hypothetical protein
MKPKTLIPFVIVLAVLGGLVFLRQTTSKAPSITQQVGLQNLVADSVDANDVDRIVLFATATPEEKVELTRGDDGWVAASHFNAPVQEDKVDDYLDSVLGLQGEPRHKAQSQDELESYQLQDDESFRVQFFTGDGDPAVDLLVGKAPDFRTVFLRKAGDMQVYVEATNPRREAGVSAEDMTTAPKADTWLDKAVVALEDPSAINKVALSMPGKELTFEQVEVEQPAPEPADPAAEGEQPAPEPVVTKEWQVAAGGADMPLKANALTTYTNRFRNYAATQIVDPAKKEEYGLDNPAYRATISVEGQDDIVIEGARPEADGSGYLRVASSDNDLVYEVSSFAFGNLFPKGNTLFDLPKLTLAQDNVSQVVINSEAGRIVANKDGDTWTLSEPATEMTVKPGPLNTLLTTLSNWTAADFAGADAATGNFDETVEVSAAGVTRTLSIGDAVDGADMRYAKVDGVDTVLMMNQADADKVLLGPADVLNLEVLGLTSDDVNAIDYRKGGDMMKLRRTDDGWTVAVNDGDPFAVDAEQAQAFVNDVVNIEAEGVRFDQAKVVGDPHFTLTVQAASGLPRFVTVGTEEDGIHTLAVSNQNQVFEMSKLSIDKITVKGDALKTPPEAPAEDAAEDAAKSAPSGEAADRPAPANEAAEAAPAEEDAPAEEMKEEAPAEGADAPAEGGEASGDDWDELSIGSMSGQAVL